MKRNSSHGSRGDSNYSSLHPETIISLQNNPSVFTRYVRVIQPLDTIRRLSCFHSPNGNHRPETVVSPSPIAAASRRRSFSTDAPVPAGAPSPEEGRVEGSAAGAKVHRLLVWKTYDSAAQSHQPDLSTSLVHDLSASRLASRPRRRAGE